MKAGFHSSNRHKEKDRPQNFEGGHRRLSQLPPGSQGKRAILRLELQTSDVLILCWLRETLRRVKANSNGTNRAVRSTRHKVMPETHGALDPQGRAINMRCPGWSYVEVKGCTAGEVFYCWMDENRSREEAQRVSWKAFRRVRPIRSLKIPIWG